MRRALACLPVLLAPLLSGCIGWTTLPDERVAELEAWEAAPVTTARVALGVVSDLRPDEGQELRAKIVALAERLFPNMTVVSDAEAGVLDPADWPGSHHYALKVEVNEPVRGAGFNLGAILSVIVPAHFRCEVVTSAAIHTSPRRRPTRVTRGAEGNLLFWLPLSFLAFGASDYRALPETVARDCLYELAQHPIWSKPIPPLLCAACHRPKGDEPPCQRCGLVGE